MSKRAEEAAKKKYPIYWAKAVLFDGNTIDLDANEVTRNVFKLGYELAEKDLGWHSVEESLPEMDEEVIVLKDKQNTGLVYEISFGHLVDTERCIDYNGWNVPDVKFWMPMPKIPEE